jgi:hypothetical protein
MAKKKHALTKAQANHIPKMNGVSSVVFSKLSYEQAWSNAIGLSYNDVISEHGAMMLALGSERSYADAS